MGKQLNKSSARNVTLDVFKILAAYSVVFIHNKFYGNFGFAIEAVARFAVPLFFVSSGYFCYNNSLEKIKVKAFRIIKIFLMATILYHFVNLFFFALQGKTDEIIPYLTGIISFDTIWRFLLINMPYSSTPLWFLIALAFTYGVHYLVVKFNVSAKLMFVISCIIIAVDIVTWEFLPAFGIVIPVVHSFVTMGYPFFSFGLFFRKHQDNLKKVRTWIPVLMIIFGVIESVVSRLLFEYFELYNGSVPKIFEILENSYITVPELYVGTMAIIFSLVVISIKYPNPGYPNFVTKLAACSTYIYIFHRLCGMIIIKGLKLVGVDTSTVIVTNLITIAVCVLATVVALILLKLDPKLTALATPKKNKTKK